MQRQFSKQKNPTRPHLTNSEVHCELLLGTPRTQETKNAERGSPGRSPRKANTEVSAFAFLQSSRLVTRPPPKFTDAAVRGEQLDLSHCHAHKRRGKSERCAEGGRRRPRVTIPPSPVPLVMPPDLKAGLQKKGLALKAKHYPHPFPTPQSSPSGVHLAPTQRHTHGKHQSAVRTLIDLPANPTHLHTKHHAPLTSRALSLPPCLRGSRSWWWWGRRGGKVRPMHLVHRGDAHRVLGLPVLPAHQGLWVNVLDVLGRGHTILNGRRDHPGRDVHAHCAHLRHRGVESTTGNPVLNGVIRQSSGGLHHHPVGHLGGLSQDGSVAQPREDERVVPLPNRVGLAAPLDIGEGAAARHQGLAVGPLKDLLRGCLHVVVGVGEREHNRAVAVRRHLLHKGLRKLPGNATQTQEDGGLRVDDGLHEVRDFGLLLPPGDHVRLLAEPLLVVLHLRAALVQQPHAVQHEDPRHSLLLGQALPLHPLRNDPSHTCATGASARNHHDLVLELLVEHLARCHHAGQGDCPRALDVIVEGRHLVTEALQDGEGGVLGKVLPLDDCAGPVLLHGLHEGLKEGHVLLTRETVALHPEVHGVQLQVLAVGAHVHRNRASLERRHAACRGVQRQLPNWNPHSTVPLVSDPQDGRGVRSDDHADVGEVVVLDDLVHLVDVAGRERQPSGHVVEVRELPAGLTHGWGVDDGKHLLDVLNDEVVIKVLVALLKLPKVLVLLEWCGHGREATVASVLLLLHRLHGRGQQTVNTEQAALFLRERRALVDLWGPEHANAVDFNFHYWVAPAVLPNVKVMARLSL
eukprot:RCo000812